MTPAMATALTDLLDAAREAQRVLASLAEATRAVIAAGQSADTPVRCSVGPAMPLRAWAVSVRYQTGAIRSLGIWARDQLGGDP